MVDRHLFLVLQRGIRRRLGGQLGREVVRGGEPTSGGVWVEGQRRTLTCELMGMFKWLKISHGKKE